MRPRKKILLVAGPAIAGELRLVLETKTVNRSRLRVIAAETDEDAVRAMCEHDIVLVLIDALALSDPDELRCRLRVVRDVPALIFNAEKDRKYIADFTVMSYHPRSVLMEGVRLLAMRKRGPKKNLLPNIHMESKKSLASEAAMP